MTKNARVFAIEDTLSTSDNLTAYAQALEGMDAALGAALEPYLASIAADLPVEVSEIWNALYAATAPADSGSANGNNGSAA